PLCQYFANCMVLALQNSDVFDINLEILQYMAEKPCTYYSADKIINEAGTDPNLGNDYEHQPIPVEYLQEINAASLPP
ncbi:hypothetical protein BDN70DRAFT_784832, partial [Pholiota conissans]